MQQPSSVVTPPHCPHNVLVSPVSIRPVNKSPTQTFTRPRYSDMCDLHHSFVSFTFSRPGESIWVGGSQEEPSCRKLYVLWRVGWFPSWRPASKKAGLRARAKLKLHPPLCTPPFFFTRPQSTLTPNCASSPSTEARLDSVCQDEDQPRLLSVCVLSYMPTTHMFRFYALLPVVSACIVLTEQNVLTGHLGLKWRLHRFQDSCDFCGTIKKQLGGSFRVLSSLSDGSFAEQLCNGHDCCCRSRIFRMWLRVIWFASSYKDERWFSSAEKRGCFRFPAQIPTKELAEILLSSAGVCINIRYLQVIVFSFL